MQPDFSSPVYVRSRRAYILQAMFEYFVAILVADVFLAKLLSAVGFSDGDIGIISSFISLAFVFQFFSLFLGRLKIGKKRLVLIFDTVGQMLFFGLYTIPFLPIPEELRRALVYLFIIVAYMGKYLVSTILYQWANSSVHPEKRASYSALKEIVSLLGGIVFSLGMGAIFDWFEAGNNLTGGFIFLTVAILVTNIFDFICLLLIKNEEPTIEHRQEKKHFSDILHHTFGNRNFRRVLIIAVLWKAAQYFTVGFMGTFKTDSTGNGLGMTVLFVQIISMVANLLRAVFSRPLGKYSDKRSFAAGFYLSLFLAAAAFLCNVFTTEQTWFLVIGYSVFHAVCLAGTNANTFNIMYSYVDSDYISEAMALQNCISGVIGFLCALAGGKILDAVQGAGNSFMGISMYGQQLLGAISLLICIICIIYMRVTILKEKVMKQ